MVLSTPPRIVSMDAGDIGLEDRSLTTSSENEPAETDSLCGDSPLPKDAAKTKDALEPEEMEHRKPLHTYIALITMAILNSPAKRLLLCDIYEYIMEHYPYFRNDEKSWRSCVRHKLSQCFIKTGRSDDGRGHFWAIHPANVEDFSQGDFRRYKRRRLARTDLIAHPGYQLYPTAIPMLYGTYGPVTYTPMSSVLPSETTLYTPPMFPVYPFAVSTGYVQAATTSVDPSVSSSSVTPTVFHTVSTPACKTLTSRQRLPLATQLSPLFTPSPDTHPYIIGTPHAHSPWTSYTRRFHPYTR